MINALSRKAGSRRAFSSGYKKGWPMKKTTPCSMLAESREFSQFALECGAPHSTLVPRLPSCEAPHTPTYLG